ncbi:hypothetical protein [Thermoanaerobacter mathranii]|uniref:hypothetical protein n=1 Tax=Thermoanaerobacter mathranii TaxID=583357 RepID=UPI003D6AEB07
MLILKRTSVLLTAVIFILGVLTGAGIGYYKYVYMPQKMSQKFAVDVYEQMAEMYVAGRIMDVGKDRIKVHVEIGKYDKGKDITYVTGPNTMVQIGNEPVNSPGSSVDLRKYFAKNQYIELLVQLDGTVVAVHREYLPGESLNKR